LYGTMVAVLDERDPDNKKAVIGAIHVPGLNEGIYAATGSGAWHYQGAAEPVRAQVSKTSELSQSVFVTSGFESFLQRDVPDVFVELSRKVEFGRTWGDVYGYMMVATGRAEAMIDPCLSIWDAAAVQPIIEEAGGRFTDWKNCPTYDSGDAIGSNGVIHDEWLRCLNR
jgi:histidinol-phosphatase